MRPFVFLWVYFGRQLIHFLSPITRMSNSDSPVPFLVSHLAVYKYGRLLRLHDYAKYHNQTISTSDSLLMNDCFSQFYCTASIQVIYFRRVQSGTPNFKTRCLALPQPPNEFKFSYGFRSMSLMLRFRWKSHPCNPPGKTTGASHPLRVCTQEPKSWVRTKQSPWYLKFIFIGFPCISSLTWCRLSGQNA